MKKNKLVYGTILIAFMLNTFTLNSGYCTPSRNLNRQQYIFEDAQNVTPEEIIRISFYNGNRLYLYDYNSPKDIYLAQRVLLSMYPDGSDSFREAVCMLGECLEEDGRYTKKQIDKVVDFMLNFRPSFK